MNDRELRELYDGCYSRLVGQVFAMTGDLAAAQDAVQDAFTRAVASRADFARVKQPEAWLRRVAFNSAKGRWRRLRHLDRLLRVGQPDRQETETESNNYPDHVALVQALRTLPLEQREALALYHIVDLPISEVAAIVHAPVGTVKARLARGRARLAILLSDEHDLLSDEHDAREDQHG